MFLANGSVVKEVTAKVEEIKVMTSLQTSTCCIDRLTQNDDSIPIRANKKKGTKSKKEVREAVRIARARHYQRPPFTLRQVQSEASAKLKDISIRHGFVSGKWYAIIAARAPITLTTVAQAHFRAN